MTWQHRARIRAINRQNNALRRLRLNVGLSQRQLAALMGTSQPRICVIERERRNRRSTVRRYVVAIGKGLR